MAGDGQGRGRVRGFWLLGGVVVLIAIAIVGYFGNSARQMEGETTGAIGAAKKHIQDQMSDEDVILAETRIHDFMQSETFQRMVDDEDFRRAVVQGHLDAAIQRAMGAPGEADMLALAGLDASDSVRNRLDQVVQKALGETAGQRAAVWSKEVLRRIEADPVLRGAFDPEAMKRLGEGIERALSVPTFTETPGQGIATPTYRSPVFVYEVGDVDSIIAGFNVGDDVRFRLQDVVGRVVAEDLSRSSNWREELLRRIGDDPMLRGAFDEDAMRRFGGELQQWISVPEHVQLPTEVLDMPRFRDPMTPGDIDDVIVQLEVIGRAASPRDAEALNRLLENPYFSKMMEHPGFALAIDSGTIARRLE